MVIYIRTPNYDYHMWAPSIGLMIPNIICWLSIGLSLKPLGNQINHFPLPLTLYTALYMSWLKLEII